VAFFSLLRFGSWSYLFDLPVVFRPMASHHFASNRSDGPRARNHMSAALRIIDRTDRRAQRRLPPNPSLQATADRSDASFKIINTRLLQSMLAPASGA
jgi:hypothetical protein